MGGISLTVHPLFYAFGFYYALTGRIFVFVIYTVCAVLHELGHSFVAASAGYRLNKITLMPFGAVVKGDIDGLKLIDEIKIALAGPFLNLAVGLFFVALWWLYPEIYAYTDVVAEANFSMALVNFLPAFPLDGGRVLSAFTALKLGKDKSKLICNLTGGIFAVILLSAFIVTIFHTVNPSLLFFALFVAFGTFGKAKENKYVKIFSSLSENRLLRGMPYNRLALSKNVTVKKLITVLDENAVNEIIVFDGDKAVATLSQARIEKIVESGKLYEKIEKYI